MYISPIMIRAAEERLGVPRRLRLNYPTPQVHFDFIRSTQRDGRAHDITLYLYHKNCLAVTRKPPYPEGAYRPPSGGLHILGEKLKKARTRSAAADGARTRASIGKRSWRRGEKLTFKETGAAEGPPGRIRS
ncbi:MAG TPA: hypothetical protein VF398_05805 [bacterium]|jgi:hypothetical protein